MSVKLVKTAVCATLTLGVSLGVATAQTAAPGGLTPEAIQSAIQSHVGKVTGTVGLGTGKIGAGVSPAFSSGSYTEQCYTSYFLTSGGYYYEFAFNVDGTYLYSYINSPYASSGQNSLRDVCTYGSQYVVWVDSNGNWYEIKSK